MATAAPPLPPDVLEQQIPPALRFMQGAGSAAGQPSGALQQFDPMALVEDRLNQIASMLKDVADVLVVEKPAMMPIVQRMAQAGSAIMNELQAAKSQQAPPGQAQLPNPDTQSGAVSMS